MHYSDCEKDFISFLKNEKKWTCQYRGSIEESDTFWYYHSSKSVFFNNPFYGVHHLFCEAFDSLKNKQSLSSCIVFLTAIEASIRTALIRKNETVNQSDIRGIEILYKQTGNLNMRLIKKAQEARLPIHLLAFEAEDVVDSINKNKDITIIEYRNYLHHGNLIKFCVTMNLGKDVNKNIFTPFLLHKIAFQLAKISLNWYEGLIIQREKQGLWKTPNTLTDSMII